MATEIKAKPKMVKTFVVGYRPLDIGDNKRLPGQLVPEAITWLRYENHVNCGYLQQVEVPESDFVAAVQEYCPDLARQLAPQVKVTAKRRKDER